MQTRSNKGQEIRPEELSESLIGDIVKYSTVILSRDEQFLIIL